MGQYYKPKGKEETQGVSRKEQHLIRQIREETEDLLGSAQSEWVALHGSGFAWARS